jgi:protein CWC15
MVSCDYFPFFSRSEEDANDNDDDDDDEDDDEKELQAELERIRRERALAEERRKQEEKELEEKFKRDNAMNSNPLLNADNVSAKVTFNCIIINIKKLILIEMNYR